MTNAEMAHALSLATRKCQTHYKAKMPDGSVVQYEPDSVCAYCLTFDGRPFVLGERARKQCSRNTHRDARLAATCLCGGSGWLTALLLPDGRIDEDLLREALEEAGCQLTYSTEDQLDENGCTNIIEGWWVGYGDQTGENPSLAFAAMQALGLEVTA